MLKNETQVSNIEEVIGVHQCEDDVDNDIVFILLNYFFQKETGGSKSSWFCRRCNSFIVIF